MAGIASAMVPSSPEDAFQVAATRSTAAHPNGVMSNDSMQSESESGDSGAFGDPLVKDRTQTNEQTPPVYKFVLTGGPCAGKTTAMKHMRDFFSEKGFRVFTVPESATSMFTNGATLRDVDHPAGKYAFQWSILRLQMEMEDSFERVARMCGKPSILLCDRGLMDGSVYMPSEMWDRLVEANGMDELTLQNGRYHGIFHLVTAAMGASDHYTLENNEARSEPLELAIEVDARTEQAYLGHPRHFVFDNSTSFEAKIERVTRAASRLAGLPSPSRRAGKFLLAQPPPPVEDFPVEALVEFEAEKVFLRRPTVDDCAEASLTHTGAVLAPCVSSESFLEKRGRNGLFLYGITTFSTYEDGLVSEVTRPLSAVRYEKLIAERADSSRLRVRQRRVAFLWRSQAFELHTDVEPAFGVSVLYCRSEGGQLSLPTFLPVED